MRRGILLCSGSISGRRGKDPEPLQELVDSLARSVDIFTYHLVTARDALKGIVDERQSVDEALKIVWLRKPKEYRYAMA